MCVSRVTIVRSVGSFPTKCSYYYYCSTIVPFCSHLVVTVAYVHTVHACSARCQTTLSDMEDPWSSPFATWSRSLFGAAPRASPARFALWLVLRIEHCEFRRRKPPAPNIKVVTEMCRATRAHYK
jgi:hypothetical protein